MSARRSDPSAPVSSPVERPRRAAPRAALAALAAFAALPGCERAQLPGLEREPRLELASFEPAAAPLLAPSYLERLSDAAQASGAVRTRSPSRADCELVPVYAGGAPAGSLCADEVAKHGLTTIDLSDAWTPRVFAIGADPSRAPEYRAKYLELAATPSAELGLYGISPNLSLLVARVADEKRRACDAELDLAPVAAFVAPWLEARDKNARAVLTSSALGKSAIGAIQGELVCAGLLDRRAATGVLGAKTEIALDAFRRRHMIVGTGLDHDTQLALTLGGEELAYRGVLRALRERVADAAGLVEDGSASGRQEPVVDRRLDLSRFTPSFGDPIEGAAPDLVNAATDRAARELGWTSPDGVRDFASKLGPRGLRTLRVAVALPPAPAYHSATMELRVEIDRGDVFYDAPGRAALAKKELGELRGPSFVLYAKDGERDVALLRWPTTIGGWKKERGDDGEIALKYKESDVGERAWRKLIAAPAWLPPDSTPETDLVREDADGVVTLKRDLIQPGYRNAYGLAMFIHEQPVTRGAKTEWRDHGIRTHGSVDYRSLTRGSSHGCHRLYNQLVLRMSGFVLQHREHRDRGKLRAGYQRTLEWNEQTIEVEVPTRGHLYELDPPVPVKVLEGRVVGEAKKPAKAIRLASR